MKTKLIAVTFAMMLTLSATAQAKSNCKYKNWTLTVVQSSRFTVPYSKICKLAYKIVIADMHKRGKVVRFYSRKHKKYSRFPKKYCRATIRARVQTCTKGKKVYTRTFNASASGSNFRSFSSICKSAWKRGMSFANRQGQVISKTYKRKTWGGFPNKKYCRFRITIRYYK